MAHFPASRAQMRFLRGFDWVRFAPAERRANDKAALFQLNFNWCLCFLLPALFLRLCVRISDRGTRQNDAISAEMGSFGKFWETAWAVLPLAASRNKMARNCGSLRNPDPRSRERKERHESSVGPRTPFQLLQLVHLTRAPWFVRRTRKSRRRRRESCIFVHSRASRASVVRIITLRRTLRLGRRPVGPTVGPTHGQVVRACNTKRARQNRNRARKPRKTRRKKSLPPPDSHKSFCAIAGACAQSFRAR
jgi:hypothetical protein